MDKVSAPLDVGRRNGLRLFYRHLAPFRRRVALLLLLAVAAALANGLVPFVIGKFLDELLRAGGDPKGALELLGVWAAVQFIAYYSEWFGDRQGRRLSADISLNISVESLTHLLRLPVSYQKRVAVNGDLRKITEASSFISQAVRVATNLVPQCLSVVIGLAMAAMINAAMSTILIGAAIVYAVLLRRHFRAAAHHGNRQRDEFVDSWARVTAAVDLVEVVKQASAEDYEIERLRETFFSRLRSSWYAFEGKWSNISLTQSSVTFIAQILIFTTSIYAVGRHVLTIGELVAFNGYAMMLLGPMVSLGYSWESFQNALISARQVEEIYAEEPELYRPPDAVSPGTEIGAIEFDHVTFAYSPQAGDVLKDVSFTTEPGTIVAIVGETGSGKTTLVSLLSGYYFPQEGRVLIGGADTRRLDLTELRRRIAVVPQEVVLFNDSIWENLRYGSFDASDEAVIAAARLARVDDFVRDLPLGYETIVGERGVMLSVGQKQRIAIGRAILRNPSIFIFDEPTSALDSQTERLVSEALEAAAKGRSAFVVAHRLSTVRNADLILVFEKGRLRETGNHDSLMRNDEGIYRKFYEYHLGLHQ